MTKFTEAEHAAVSRIVQQSQDARKMRATTTPPEREREALLIDPATAEVNWSFEQTLDPYGEKPDLPEKLKQVGREYFARRPGSDIWVHFDDLPDEVREKLRKHPNAKPSFTVKNGQANWNVDAFQSRC